MHTQEQGTNTPAPSAREPKTTAAVEITIARDQYVPSEPSERVAWLEQFGVPPRSSKVLVVARLRDWIAAGYAIDTAGDVGWTSYHRDEHLHSCIGRALETHAAAIATKTGVVPAEIGPDDAGPLLAAGRAAAESARRKEAREYRARELAHLEDRILSCLDDEERPGYDIAAYSAQRLVELEALLAKPLDDGPLETVPDVAMLKKLVERLRAERERELAAKAESEAAWIAWALASGSEDLRAAIRDDYPLGNRVRDELCDALLPRVAGAMRETDHTASVSYGKPRTVPNERSRELHAAIVAAVTAAAEHAPPGTTVEIGQIVHAETWRKAATEEEEHDADDDGDVKVKCTGVPVTVRAKHFGEYEIGYFWGARGID